MSGLAEFYADRLDEAERRALLFLADPTGRRDSTRALQLGVDAGAYVEWFGPAWVLRQVEAGRKILAEHRQGDGGSVWCWRCDPGSGVDSSPAYYPCLTLRAAASGFSGHPAYRAEWKPDE